MCTDFRVVALWKAHDEVVKLTFFGHPLYIFIGDCGTWPSAQSDIELYGAWKEIWLLLLLGVSHLHMKGAP